MKLLIACIFINDMFGNMLSTFPRNCTIFTSQPEDLFTRWYLNIIIIIARESILKPDRMCLCVFVWMPELILLHDHSISFQLSVKFVVCAVSKICFSSLVFQCNQFSDPGSPAYSIYPASTAEHTSLLFFMLPSTTITVPQPLQLQRWAAMG